MADGQLPTSSAALYTVAASTTTWVKFFNLYNTNAAAQTILIYINVSGTDRLWRRVVLEQNESADLLDPGQSLQLEAADIIKGVTTTGSAVDYVITGVESA